MSSSPYVTDTAYVYAFNCDLAPAWLDMVALLAGVAPPDRRRSFTWCELGCGQGLTAAILAATHPNGAFYALDLNAEHIDNARRVATRCGAGNLTLHAGDFGDTADLDWPRFDYIVAHGVYSWVDDSGRANLRRFVDRHLAPGGLAHVSYNAMPGWAADLPLQFLLRAFAERADGDSIAKFEAAEARTRLLTALGAPVLKQSRIASETWDLSRSQFAPSYFAHEYLPHGWRPLYVTEVRADMATIGLQPVGSTHLVENFDAFMLRAPEREALAEIPEPDLRELARDYLITQRFRRDVFVREGRALDDARRRRQLLECIFTLTRPVSSIAFRMLTPAGSISFDDAAARTVVAALASGPRRLADIVGDAGSEADLLAAGLALACAEMIRPVGPGTAPVAELNDGLFALGEPAAPLPYLVLPCGTALMLEPELIRYLRTGGALDEHLAAWPGFLFSQLW